MSEATAPSTSKITSASSTTNEEMEEALRRIPFRVELSFDLKSSRVFPADIHHFMVERMAAKAPEGIVRVTVADSRSQWRNRQIARRRLAGLLEESMRKPKRRRPTKPSTGARERRLKEKRRRAEKKAGRRPPTIE